MVCGLVACLMVAIRTRGRTRSLMTATLLCLAVVFLPLAEQPILNVIDAVLPATISRPRLVAQVFDPVSQVTQNHCQPAWEIIQSYNSFFKNPQLTVR